MPLRAADFESAAYAIPPLRAGPQCRRAAAVGTPDASDASRPGPMLDSPSLRIAVRRDPPIVEDLRSTTVSDDPVQRRDLILLEQARDGNLDAFNDLVTLYQDQLFALVVRMVPDRDQASDCVQEAFFSAFRNMRSFRGGSVKSWLNRICVNAAMDTQRARKRRPVQPYPELDDESWQPPTGPDADPERTAVGAERTRALSAALASITDDQRTAIVLFDVEGYDYAEIADDDQRVAGHGQVAHPPGPAGAARPARGPDGAVPWLTATHGPRPRARRQPARRRPPPPRTAPAPPARSRAAPTARRSSGTSWRCPRPRRRCRHRPGPATSGSPPPMRPASRRRRRNRPRRPPVLSVT